MGNTVGGVVDTTYYRRKEASGGQASARTASRASCSPATACADASVGSTPGIVFAGHSVCRR